MSLLCLYCVCIVSLLCAYYVPIMCLLCLYCHPPPACSSSSSLVSPVGLGSRENPGTGGNEEEEEKEEDDDEDEDDDDDDCSACFLASLAAL